MQRITPATAADLFDIAATRRIEQAAAEPDTHPRAIEHLGSDGPGRDEPDGDEEFVPLR